MKKTDLKVVVQECIKEILMEMDDETKKLNIERDKAKKVLKKIYQKRNKLFIDLEDVGAQQEDIKYHGHKGDLNKLRLKAMNLNKQIKEIDKITDKIEKKHMIDPTQEGFY